MKRLLLFFPFACLLANPGGMQTMSGSAASHQSGSTLTVTNSDKAILHWENFSIGKGETTRFVQPDAHSSVLNRVTGPDISKIMGRLESNGSVVLINERGLIVGPDGVIDTAGFIGSTFDVLDESFLKGKELLFEGEGDGHIVHMGHINARGGQIYLKTGRDAIVEGTISAPRASVTIEGGRMILREEALVDVSDKSSPGEVNIYARVIRLEEGSEIRADSVTSDAGNIMVMSEEETRFYGHISAQSVEGKGGTAEVSSRGHLHVSGHADLRSKEDCDGLFILDPGSVDVVSGPNTVPPVSMDTFNDGYINAQLVLSSLTIATQNSTNLAAEILTVDGAVVISWLTSNTLAFIAGQQIIIDTGASIASAFASGNVFTALDLKANRGTTPVPGSFTGILIDAATISVVDGDILMEGNSGTTGSFFDGIRLDGASVTTTGAGKISMIGRCASTVVSSNRGVHLLGAALMTLDTASTGTLTIIGTSAGDGTGDSNQGILMGNTATIDSKSTSASAGNIRLVGTGGAGTNDNAGIFINDNVVFTTVNSNINLVGTGSGSAGQNFGISLGNSTSMASTGTGRINLVGQGGSSGANVNYGIFLTNSAAVSTVNGSIRFVGSGGGVTNDNAGIHTESTSSVLSTGTGNITFIGTSQLASSHGVDIEASSTITSSGTGKITMEGTGSPSGSNNSGLRVTGSIVSDTGAVTLIGRTSGTGTTGVNFSQGGSVSTTTSAPISVTAFSDITLDGPAFITGGSGTVTINSSRDVVLTGGSAVTEPAVIELGTGNATFNIGRDLILTAGTNTDSEAQIGSRMASSSANMTFNNVGGKVQLTGNDLVSYALIGHGDGSFAGTLGGNITFTNVGTNVLVQGANIGAGTLGFAQIGHADFTASTLNGNIFITANGNIRVVGGTAGATTNARIGNGGLGNALSFGSSTMQLIAGINLNMISRTGEAQIQNFNGPLTLVVDNLFPSSPDFGTGSFVINSLLTATGALKIYTVSPDQNVINDQINGANFVLGPFDVDDSLQQFNTYFPGGTYQGTAYKFYYKVGGKTFRAIQIPAMNALTIANAQLTDLLPVFRYMRLANYPVYHAEFCEFKDKKRFGCDPTLDPYGSFLFEDDVYWINSPR